MAASQLTRELVLQKARVGRMEDVKNLNLSSRGLSGDLSVLVECTNLAVLTLSMNALSDDCCNTLARIPTLEELYLSRNRLVNIESVAMLVGALKRLRVLWLEHNPLSQHPLYRQLTLSRAPPSLLKLDTVDVTPSERAVAQGISKELFHLLAQKQPHASGEQAPTPALVGNNGVPLVPALPPTVEAAVPATESSSAPRPLLVRATLLILQDMSAADLKEVHQGLAALLAAKA